MVLSRLKMKRMRLKTAKQIIDHNQPEMNFLEGNLINLAEIHRYKTILVTSCRPKEGKTTAAVMMAHVLGRGLQPRVLLIDANLGRPALHELFPVSRQPGFTNFLLGENEAEECIRPTDQIGLSVMGHGRDFKESLELFSRNNLHDRFSLLAEKYDYLVFDGDSALTATNISLMARQVDAVMLVIECERTKWEQVTAAKEKIAAAGGNLLGVIMNKRRYYVPRFLYNKI